MNKYIFSLSDETIRYHDHMYRNKYESILTMFLPVQFRQTKTTNELREILTKRLISYLISHY